MTDVPPPGMSKAIRSAIEHRLHDALDVLKEFSPSAVSDRKQDHVSEFRDQTIGLISDGLELLENDGDMEQAREILTAADTFLDATQDLLVHSDAYALADELGEVREQVDTARSLVSLIN